MTSDMPIDSQSGRWPDEMPARVPQHSLEAEQAVLGGLMLSNRAWEYVGDTLADSDFYLPGHKVIFAGIRELLVNGKPCDAVTLYEHLRLQDRDELAGGLAYLAEIVHNTPSTANIRAYADIIRERSTLRQVVEAGQAMADAGLNPEGRSATDILDTAGARLLEIGQDRGKADQASDGVAMLEDYLNYADHRFNNPDDVTGVSTGFVDLDKILTGNGLQNDDLIIVAGRPSSGKTTFGMNMAEAALQRATGNVVVYSVEMPKRGLMQRMIASLGRLEVGKAINPVPAVMTDDDWMRMTSAAAKLKPVAHRLFVDDTSGISPAEMRTRTRRLAREKGPISLIVVDYLQLMTVPGMGGDNRTAEISEISRSLKALAKEHHCPVVALSQLSRKCEDRPNKRPVNSDLRESGAIEQDADVIFMVYRDEVYHPETQYKGIAEIICTKQRQGAIGTTYMGFLGKYACFDNLAAGSLPVEEEAPRRGGGLRDKFRGDN